jgi:DNA-binding LacI/PurR family transcriptional regulator
MKQLDIHTLSVGSWCQIGHPANAEILAGAGFDWMAADCEHGEFEDGQIGDFCRAGRLRCLVALCLSGLFEHWTADQSQIPCLLPPDSDHAERVRLGLGYLLEQGCRHPVILSLAPDNTSGPARALMAEERQGAALAWSKADIAAPPPEPIAAGPGDRAAFDQVTALFGQPGTRPDGILVNHDLNTQGVLFALLELGLRIPRDVVVVTHENRGAEHFSPVPLARLVCDPRDYAVATLAYLRRHGRKLQPGRMQVPGTIKPRLIIE